MDNFTSSVGKIKIDTFSNSSLNSAQNVFKKDFYSKANKQNIDDYEDIDYSIDIDLQEQVELHKDDKSFWETFGDALGTAGATVVTFATSVATGIVDVGETIVDGAVQIAGGIQAYKVQALASVVSLVDKDAGQYLKNISDKMKQDIQDFVSYDASGKLYDKAVTAMGIDEEIAYGFAHTAGNLVGSVAGYAAITVVTGGAGTVMLSAAAAGGATAENAYAKGASFDEAMIASSTSAILGAVSGGSMDKLGVAAKGVTSLKGVAGYTLAGAGIGGGEAFANSLVEYATFGNNNYDSFGDYYKETGGVLNTVIGAGAGGLSIGGKSFKEKNRNKLKIESSPDVINKNLESSTVDRIKNKLYFNKTQKFSNEQAFQVYKSSIDDAIERAKQSGDKDIQNMLEKLYILKKDRPNFAINFDVNNGAYSEAYTTGSIALGADVINGNRKGVVYHELGHTLHGVINNSKVPIEYMNVKSSVYNHMSKNTSYVASVMDYFQNSQSLAFNDATQYFDNNLSKQVVDQLNNADWDTVANNLRNSGFSEQQIQEYINIDFNTQYNNIRNSEISRIADDIQREWGVDAASDIVGSVFNGNKRFAVLDANGNKIYLGGDITYSHSKDYYKVRYNADGSIIELTLSETNEASFHEQIANFVQLKLSGNTSTLDMLHGLLGDDWYNMMDNQFNKITNYFK